MVERPRTTKLHDIGTTMDAIEQELRRLKLSKHNIHIMLWLDFNGYLHWERLDAPGERSLLQFLQRCRP